MKGSTAILILSLLEREEMYGYQITQKLKLESNNVFEMKEGTLYPMLHALENEHAIVSYWVDADNGKKRKYYRITDLGRKVFKEKKQEWEIYSNAVNKIIGGILVEEFA